MGDHMTQKAAPVLIVHRDDVDLPWVKAKAADLGVDVVASPNVPRGQAFIASGEVRPDAR